MNKAHTFRLSPLKPTSGPVARDAGKQANQYFSNFLMHLKADVGNEDDMPLDSVDRHVIKPSEQSLLFIQSINPNAVDSIGN